MKTNLFEVFDSIDDKYIYEVLNRSARTGAGKSRYVAAGGVMVAVAGIIITCAVNNDSRSINDNEIIVSQKEGEGAVLAYNNINSALAENETYPYNYSGMYIDGDVLNILITDRETDEKYMSMAGEYKENVVLKQVDRSYAELQKLLSDTLYSLSSKTECDGFIRTELNTIQINIKDDGSILDKMDLVFDETTGNYVSSDGIIYHVDRTNYTDMNVAKDEKIKYDIDQDSDEWKNMDVGDKISSLNIEPEKLKEVSTDRLLELTMDNKMAFTYFSALYEEGYIRLCNTSTVFNELVGRIDLNKCAISKYRDLADNYDHDRDWTRKFVLEGIIRYRLFESMTDDERREITRIHDAINDNDLDENLKGLIETYRE